jgi:hypothetical protein
MRSDNLSPDPAIGRQPNALYARSVAQWIVRGGMQPGEQMPEHSKAFTYTGAQYVLDGERRGEAFEAVQAEANRYASKLQAGGLMWVTVDYVWRHDE